MTRPRTVAHADWSKTRARRYVARAEWRDTRYIFTDPVPANGLPDAALTGFDFPVGVPSAFARLAGIHSFVDALRNWPDDFYSPCAKAEEISVHRPFYPVRPGGTSLQDLAAVLGADRLRDCDRVAGAAELFWLIGAKHPGHAAITGWRDLLAPAVRSSRIALWPFEGTLEKLLRSGKPVVAECYPALVYRWLGIPAAFGKRSQMRRAAQAPLLRRWAAEAGVGIDADVESGFVSDDAFDAVLGLIGMLEVILGRRPAMEPADASIRDVEGWILGLDATDRATVNQSADARTAAR